MGSTPKSNKAQTTLEYAVIAVVVVAALLAMQIYLKRSAQGRLRQLADELGPQYAPGNTEGNSTIGYQGVTDTYISLVTEKMLNERQLLSGKTGQDADVDFDKDGIPNEDRAVASEVASFLGKPVFTGTGEILRFEEPARTTQESDEKVGEFEKTLF